jgi:cytochrome P450
MHYARDPIGAYARMGRRYGRLFYLPLPPRLAAGLVVTGEAEGAREIFSAPLSSFGEAFGTASLEDVAGPGSMLLLSGERHRRERKLLSPHFHGARVRVYGDRILETTYEILERLWRPGAKLPAVEAAQRIAAEVILRAIFGLRTREEIDRYDRALRAGSEAANPLFVFLPATKRELWGFGPWAKFVRLRDRVDALLLERIEQARREPGDDILSRALATGYDDGSPVAAAEMKDELRTLLLAGHETTANALAWAVYELHRHPEALSRLRDELDALGASPRVEALTDQPYLEAVVSETLRLHPAIPDVTRLVKPGFTLRGYALAENEGVAVSIPLVHSDPELYPQPERFRPERFLERRFGPHEFVAFGGGHRRCLGAAFAMFEAKLVLGTMLANYELELTRGASPRTVRQGIVLAPERGIPIRVKGPRRPAPATRAASAGAV